MTQPIPRQTATSEALWFETSLADRINGTPPWDSVVELNDRWDITDPFQHRLARGFMIGRRALQAVSYGHNYWPVEYDLIDLVDPAPFTEKHPGIRIGTERLLQLVILSRAGVEAVDDNWSLPQRDSIKKVMGEMVTELGIVPSDTNDIMFPGLDDSRLAAAILDGTLRVGDDSRPEPRFFNPPS